MKLIPYLEYRYQNLYPVIAQLIAVQDSLAKKIWLSGVFVDYKPDKTKLNMTKATSIEDRGKQWLEVKV